MKRGIKHWLKEALSIVVIISVLAVAVDWFRSKDIPTESLPPLASTTVSGEWIDVIKLSYKEPVVVYFWATWCPACKFVSPTIDWVAKHYTVVGVSASSPQAARFMQHKGYNFTNIDDPKGQLLTRWGVSVTPTIFIIKDGHVESITTGITTPPGLLARIWLSH
jgi:thiol-disulfide isomerase/thioredoxin